MRSPEIGTFNSRLELEEYVAQQIQAGIDSCSSEAELQILREYTAQVDDTPEYVDMLLATFDKLAAKRKEEIA